MKKKIEASIEDKLSVEVRFQALLKGFDELENLFKTSQLAMLDFRTSILNEYRYCARALVDYCNATSPIKKQESLARAEVALSAAMNDVVDYIVNSIKLFVAKLYEKNWGSKVKSVLDNYNYKDVARAIQSANKLIAETRRERSTRFEKYVELAKSEDFQKLRTFALDLLTIEYECEADGKSGRSRTRKYISSIRDAIGNNPADTTKSNFELYLQPKFFFTKSDRKDSKGPRIYGAEALIRLNFVDDDKSTHTKSPADFFNIAHRASLSDQIGDWVVDSAINIIKEWKENDTFESKFKNFDLAINISPSQMATCSFAEDFREKVVNSKVDHLLSIELTEDWQYEEGEHIDVAYRLRNLSENTRVSIDDFGTGSTRIEYIANLDALDSLKIDKSLIDGLMARKKDRSESLIKGILAFAKSNNLKVIAEGVEYDQQLDSLLEMGVEYFQGFHPLLGKPIPLYKFNETYLK